ncbi:MAG: glycoside hydrolase family 2 [Mediterranea sp.]|jgi:beta-galactosidase|nr:glycoside hydrolase family 2 [Mediterranea sp.]
MKRTHNTLALGLLAALCAWPHDSAGQDASAARRLEYPYPFAPSEGLVNRMEKEYRKEICLNGLWEFQPVALPADYTYGKGVAPALPLPESGRWGGERIKIPSPWNVNTFAYNGLEGPDHRPYPSYPKDWEQVKMAWMRKTVTLPADWDGMRIMLHFEAVAGATDVYVNGEKVGDNFDLFLPFSVDITDKLTADRRAEIWVGVRAHSLFDDTSTIGRRVVPAGSMWGYHVAGIWQDVFLLALPKVRIEEVYVKPLLSEGVLEMEISVRNNTGRKADMRLRGDVRRWINQAGTDVNLAPVPAWELGAKALDVPPANVAVPPNASTKVVVRVPVAGQLERWSPERPNLYALLLALDTGRQTADLKYERFGWREWSLRDGRQCLNGEPYPLRGDSWHFMGVPQLTRRYAWAWFTAIKGMNGNAVRPHAQVYPRFYLDMADEMGICVLDETANWASDGGPKLDSGLFWERSKEHLERLVRRDRNHASIFGWSVSNENKPVILHVFNKPELMTFQKRAWQEWRDIVRQNDPTRPWISADGEDDGDGTLPVTIGHYGDMNDLKRWAGMGKPWGVGEHGMAYYGTPEQVSKYNGERAYESQLGRMEGLANECYGLLTNQRAMGASYSTVFNMAWYALKPLPLGKRDLTTKPDPDTDGVFFAPYLEGLPGIQPERIGPYCTTFNPGYDPNLPLFEPWPMYDAMRAANATPSAWSAYAAVDRKRYEAPEPVPAESYAQVVFVGKDDSRLKRVMDTQGVMFAPKADSYARLLYIVDGTYALSAAEKKSMAARVARGADVWIWCPTPQTLDACNEILPLPLALDSLRRSSFLPVQRSWLRGLNNSDFYFCELQRADVSHYALKGRLVDEGEVLLNACRTDWRAWNQRPEELKTASTLRSEYECVAATPVFVRYQDGNSRFYVSTLREFANVEKGYRTLSALLKNAGIACRESATRPDEMFFVRGDRLVFPAAAKRKLTPTANGWALDIEVFSPRPLDNLLIEPDMPKLSLTLNARASNLTLNDTPYTAANRDGNSTVYRELPLRQGWNKLRVAIGEKDKDGFDGSFGCDNGNQFLNVLKIRFATSRD